LKRFLIATAAILTTLSSVGATAFADVPNQSISLSPATEQVTVAPGSAVTKSLDVINSGSDNFSASLSVLPYRVTGTNYDPHFTQLPGTVDASQWVALDTKTVTVASLKLQTVHYTVTVPKNTAPGGYYAVIFAETANEATGGSGVVSHNRIGDILYITVSGSVKQAGSLSGASIPFFHVATSIDMDVDISNQGGVHFPSTATLSVTNFSNTKTLFKGSYDRIILPQTVRQVTATWQPTSPIGIYQVHRQATILGKTDTLPVAYILVISPWFLIGFISLVLILLAFLAQVWRHRLRKRRHKS